MCPFHDNFSHFFRIYQNKEVARCYHGYCSYAPLSDIVKHQNQCTIPSSSRICIQISFTYPALPKPLSRPLFPFCLSTSITLAVLGCVWWRGGGHRGRAQPAPPPLFFKPNFDFSTPLVCMLTISKSLSLSLKSSFNHEYISLGILVPFCIGYNIRLEIPIYQFVLAGNHRSTCSKVLPGTLLIIALKQFKQMKHAVKLLMNQ